MPELAQRCQTYVDSFYSKCARQNTYHVINKFRACARDMAKPFKHPSLSELPSSRLNTPESPFTYVGLDLCGAFKVLKENKYILLMTCLITRAVALEVIDSLKTAQIYVGIRRITSRTTMPRYYLSDNMKQLLAIREYINQPTTSDVTWKLIPTYNPWMGGMYERMIGLLKISLYRSTCKNSYCGPV